MERRTKAATVTWVYLLLVAGILVLANVLSASYFKRFDVTDTERFTLSTGSKRLVCEGLSKELNVDFYVTRGLPQTDLFIEDVTNLFNEYANASYKKEDGSASPPSQFKFKIIEPKTEDEKKAAKDEGLQEQQLSEESESGDQKTSAEGFLGFVLKYGNEKEVIGYWPPNNTQGIEFFISNKIREVRDRDEGRKSRYAIITGKDEIKLSDSLVPAHLRPGSLKAVFAQFFPFYEFEEVDLKDGETQLDSGLIGVIITQPQKDYTEKELRRIDEFLMLGGKALVVMASAVNLEASDKEMKATLNTRGLDKLLSGYGIELKREAAIDFGSTFQITGRTNMGKELTFINPAIPILERDDSLEEDEKLFDDSFPTFFRMPQIPFPFPSPLVVHKEKQPNAEFKVVARTSPRTSIITDDTTTMSHKTAWKETDPQEQKTIGVSVIGQMRSAFAGSGDDMGIKANAETPKDNPSRLLVLSSSQFLANPFARSGNPPPLPQQMQMIAGPQPGDRELGMMGEFYLQNNFFITLVTSFKGTLDWMANDPDLLAVNAKLLQEPALTYSMKKPRGVKGDTEEDMKKKWEAHKQEKKDLQRRIRWWLSVLPAALVAAFGIVRWRLREAQRDKAIV